MIVQLIVYKVTRHVTEFVLRVTEMGRRPMTKSGELFLSGTLVSSSTLDTMALAAKLGWQPYGDIDRTVHFHARRSGRRGSDAIRKKKMKMPKNK
jgi:hypothetical protein